MARTYTNQERADAIALYLEHGACETARRTGIPQKTISSWARRQGVQSDAPAKTAAAVEASRRKWELLRTTMADNSGDLAARILDICHDALDDLRPANPRELKDLVTAGAILIDKAQLLDGHATSRTEATINDQRQVVGGAREQGLRLVSNG